MSTENSPQIIHNNCTEGSAGIDALSEKRRRWVKATRENDFEDGIKRLLTQLYPDTAHFIFELLQNAEDAYASEVRFNLNQDHLVFEHNGSRLFCYDDVDRITSIGRPVQRDDDPTRIGKFGIGFKAVFAYTRHPQVRSGPYHFRIVDMVIPEKVKGGATASTECHETRFLFPFDNPEKPCDTACSEVENSLLELEDTTLLFLKNIRKIQYRLPDSTTGSMGLHQCDDPNHIFIAVDRSNSHRSLHHFLRFDREVYVNDETEESKTCRIAIAFGLRQRSDDVGWRITAMSPGRVCIYFPAIKETSNLRFHLHAPFASTVARDSVRECESNDRLREHIGELIADSLIDVRRYGYLTVSFLEILPNDSDGIPHFYRPFMTRLIEIFRERELLPMKRGGHAAASNVYRAERSVLSDLIDDADLAVLLREEDPTRHLWIANPPQRNQGADRFLKMLKIETWGVEDLIECLSVYSDELELWMKKKSHEWHQRLYALLDEQLPRGRNRHVPKRVLSELQVILCTDGSYRTGKECYLPDSHGHSDEDFPRVDRRVYSSGNDKKQQDAARRFLEQAGVLPVDEAVLVETILKARYTQSDSSIDDDTVRQDMEAFMRLAKQDQKQTGLFSDYFVFEADGGGGFAAQPLRCKPKDVFLDAPYENTGLYAYHVLPRPTHRKRRLSIRYQDLGIDPGKLFNFAVSTGAQGRLKAKEQFVPPKHPQYDYLWSAPGNWSAYGKRVDFTIEELDELIHSISLGTARLIWRTMHRLDPAFLKACIQKNRSQNAHFGDSTIVHELRQARWVPQCSDGTVNFVRPCDSSSALLPEGFSYERGKKWTLAVQFGKAADDRSAKAKRDGFDSYSEKQQMVEIAKWCRIQGVAPDHALQLLRDVTSASPADSVGKRDGWASGQASSNEFETAGEPRAVLLAIGEWWKRNKDERRREYDRLVYPQDFDPARLQDEPINRSAWLTLFALAAFNTLGRTQDAQHRTFIERGYRDGWWSEIARSTPPDDVKPWLDRLRVWSGVEQVDEYQLWRRAFVDLYTIVRWLDEYAIVMRKLPHIAAQRDGDPVSLHDVLRPGQSPLLRELGIEAAPLDRTLGIGINWMIREMLRNRTYDAKDEAIMAPYCWMPSERVRKLLRARLLFDRLSDNANSDDSRHVRCFVVEHVGNDCARFHGDFDLPLQLITRKEYTEALNRCFGDGMIGQ